EKTGCEPPKHTLVQARSASGTELGHRSRLLPHALPAPSDICRRDEPHQPRYATWMAVRHLVSWCLLLLAQPAFAHEDHESHPIHAHADTLLLDLAQAIALGANNGPEVIKSKATHAAGRD